MNTLKYIITAILALSMLSCAHAAPACPSDDNAVNADTVFYGQVCAVNDASEDGVIRIGANNITVDCNKMVLVGGFTGVAIANPGYDNVTIKNCMIRDYNVGIWLHTAANSNKIMDSNITHSNFGIHILASTDANIWDNNVDKNNLYGIYIANDSNRIWVSDNNLSDNNRNGIEFSQSGDANIFRNTIGYNYGGLNSGGILTDAGSGDINIADNNIVGNIQNGILLNSQRHSITDNNIVGSQVNGISAGTDTNILRNIIRGSNTACINMAANGKSKLIIKSNIIDSGCYIGLYMYNATRVLIQDNNISNTSANRGIYFTGTAADVNILDNNISYNASSGLVAYSPIRVGNNNVIGNGAYGILVNKGSGDMNISNNRVKENGSQYGIYGDSSGIIENNDVNHNAWSGIFACGDTNVSRNSVTHNGSGNDYFISGDFDAGISTSSEPGWCASSADLNISDNNVSYNNSYGIIVDNSDVVIRDNNITDNNYGVFFITYPNNVLQGNDFRRNLYAVYVYPTTHDINILDNTIDGNNQYGIYLGGAYDINIVDNNISDSNFNGLRVFTAVVDINLTRNTLRNNTQSDINLEDANISFIDGNYGSIAFADINAKISRYWSVDFNVRHSDTYAAIADANIDINSQYSAALTGRFATGSNGTTGKVSVLEYDQNSVSTAPYYYSPHKVIASHGAYDTNTYTKTVDSNSAITVYLSPRGVSITSPKSGEVLSNTAVTFSYSASAGFSPVNRYWVKLDSQPLYTDNGTSATYSTTLTSGSHAFYVIANGPQDVNSPVASVSFTINLGAGSAQCGDGVCGSGETAASCAADCPPVCGDNACTGTETLETCAADCIVGCGDNICDPDAGETCSTCASDCGECAPGEEQLPAEETVLEQTQTGQATVQQIEDVLRDVGFTVSEIEAAKEAGTRLSIARTIIVEKKAAEEGAPESYSSQITLAVTNTASSALKNVRIVEVIPKNVANTSNEVTSARPFAVLKSDPVIQFSISEIPAGGTAEVKYSLAKKLTEEQVADYPPSIPAYAIEAAEATCANVKCNDKNPCTDDLCFDGECAYVYAKDGTTCGFGEECMQGICRGLAFAVPVAGGVGLDMMTLTAIVVVIAAAAVGLAIYIRRR